MCRKSLLLLVSLQLQLLFDVQVQTTSKLGNSNGVIKLNLFLGLKEEPKTSNRNIINHKNLSPENNFFSFLMPFHIVISGKKVGMGNPKETEALILDSPPTSCVSWTNHGPSMSQILQWTETTFPLIS